MRSGRRTASRIHGTLTLYRAVTDAELASLRSTQRFSLLPGLECKYFAITLAGAQSFARRAEQAFGEGPFTIVETSVLEALITADMLVTVDAAIKTVVLTAEQLTNLGPPAVLEIPFSMYDPSEDTK